MFYFLYFWTDATSKGQVQLQQSQRRSIRKIQELEYKKIEQSLFEQFASSPDPYNLNLILIENSRDYAVNKYNTLSGLIAKSFERWVSLPANANLNYFIDDELKIDAFVIASKHNLLIVDYVANAYQLNTNNIVLLPYLNERVKKLDHKDKALLISALMLHDHFDCEQVVQIFLNKRFKFAIIYIELLY